tara:strand:- start:6219 stop:6629 length:411 start_codon:yes stop_codon:yes gene_type:complete
MARPDTYLEKRLAQCLVKGIKPGFVGRRFLGLDGQISMKLADSMVGGSWLNGEVFLTSDAVVFLPSILDRALVKKETIPELRAPLSDLVDVHFRKGALAKILVLDTAEVSLSLRGLGMDRLAEAIRTQMNLQEGRK